MLKLVARRLVWSVPLVFVTSALTFVLVSLVPGNPAEMILGPYASASQVAALQRHLGLDEPVYTQYWHWLENAVQGNFGTSLVSGQSVTSLLSSRLTVSLNLIIGGTILASVLGVSAGTIAATRGGRLGRFVEAAAALGLAIPNFWFGLVLIEIFAVTLGLFPAFGFVAFSSDPLAWFQSLVLPVVAISLAGATQIAVQTRDSMTDVMGREFIRLLEANGIGRRSLLYKHALRNAAIPIVTVIGLNFVGLLSGSVLVESVFNFPGLGSELVDAATSHDIPAIQGTVVYFTLIVVVVNILVDVAYGLLNPRVRTA